MDDFRFRLIHMLSLEDQMVDRWLFYDWSEAEVLNVSKIACKTGWAPIPQGYVDFNFAFPSSSIPLSIDSSAFDWTIHGDLMDLVLEARLDQCRALNPTYELMVRNRFKQLFSHSVFRLPDGSRFLQNFSGLMKSGWFRTINENSAYSCMLVILAYRRAFASDDIPSLWAMGDDIILDWNRDQRDVELFTQALATLGIVVKQAKVSREFAGFSFEGFTLSSTIVNPLYPVKHQFMLKHVPDELLVETCNSYSLVYALADGKHKNMVNEIVDAHSQIPQHLARTWALGLIRLHSALRFSF